jgi:hypothetical protein
VVQIASPVGEDEEDMDTRTLTNGYFADDDEDDDCIDVIVDEALLNGEPRVGASLTLVSWVWMSRLYLLVPVLTALFFAAMVALIVWGW